MEGDIRDKVPGVKEGEPCCLPRRPHFAILTLTPHNTPCFFCRYAAKAEFLARGTEVVAKTLFECGGFGDPKLGSLTLTLAICRGQPPCGTTTREVRLNPSLCSLLGQPTRRRPDDHAPRLLSFPLSASQQRHYWPQE